MASGDSILSPAAAAAAQPVRYCTMFPTIALFQKDDDIAAFTIPTGTILSIVGPARDTRFMVVEISMQRFQVFRADLSDRCIAHT